MISFAAAYHLAGANEIAASAVGLVYLFAIGPTIIVKLTAPYWFHLVGYSTRFWVAAALMSCSFIIVGCSSSVTKQVRAADACIACFTVAFSLTQLGLPPST
jgi:battenin